jgi:glycosyltransferase involved in cell wall biosynthesis
VTPPGLLQGARIVVVNWRDPAHHLAGGAEIYAWQYARALAEGGAEVEYLTARDAGQTSVERREGITIRRAGGRFTWYAHVAVRLASRWRRTDAVVDLANGVPAFTPLLVAPGTPVVLVVHHVHQRQFAAHFPAPAARLGQWLERVAARWCYRNHRTVAVSASTREEMRSQLHWPGSIGVLENGADLPRSEPDPTNKDPRRVVVLGRLVRHKRVDLVIEAVAALSEHRPGPHLDICGRGPDRDRLERVADELGVRERIIFHGYVDEATKATLLARAALHVCASDAEGWGQTVIEAAASGVPTVARDVPGLRDSVRHDETGWLVPDDPDPEIVRRRLTTALSEALTDAASPECRGRWAVACRAWAEKFDWPQMRRQARGLVIEELAGSKSRPGPHHRATAARSAQEGATCVE